MYITLIIYIIDLLLNYRNVIIENHAKSLGRLKDDEKEYTDSIVSLYFHIVLHILNVNNFFSTIFWHERLNIIYDNIFHRLIFLCLEYFC